MHKTGETWGGDLLINNLLKDAISRLKKCKSPSDSPALDAELLLAHCIEKNRTYLHTWPDAEVTTSQAEEFEKLILKRLDDYPVAYLLGSQSFWTLDLIVTPDVLIPRPETELLVETALEKISHIKNPKVLDLGTGTGAIALSIASERADAVVTATDYSEKALEIAKKNTINNRLDSQVNFIQSDWFKSIPDTKFDLIVSNPPYIDPADPHLLNSIRYEPQQALIAKNKGMEDIELIIQNSPAYLRKDSWLLLEHGYDQGDRTRKCFVNNKFTKAITLNDLNQLQRISYAKLL